LIVSYNCINQTPEGSSLVGPSSYATWSNIQRFIDVRWILLAAITGHVARITTAVKMRAEIVMVTVVDRRKTTIENAAPNNIILLKGRKKKLSHCFII